MAKAPPQGPTPDELDLECHGVPAETFNTLKAVRLVAAAMAKKNGELTVTGIAKETGYSTWQVLTLLDSPEYAALIQNVARQQCGALISRCLEGISEIVDNGKPEHKISALNAVTRTYVALAGEAAADHESVKSEKEAEALLKKLEKIHAVKRPQVTVTNGSNS